MDYGVQLFGFAKLFREDPEGFFKKIAGAGVSLLEPCVALGDPPSKGKAADPFWTLAELTAFAAMAKKHGLRIESCHLFGDALGGMEALRGMIAAHGLRYVMVNGPRDHAAAFEGYVENLRAVAAGVKGSGARLCVHNGAAEVREKIGGKTFLEAVLERCEGEVGAQIDVGWALYGGADPLEYMKRVEPYLWTLHYKDMKKNYRELPESRVHVCLGKGCLDVAAIFAYATQLGIPQLLDQDDSDGDMLEDARESVTLLRSLEG